MDPRDRSLMNSQSDSFAVSLIHQAEAFTAINLSGIGWLLSFESEKLEESLKATTAHQSTVNRLLKQNLNLSSLLLHRIPSPFVSELFLLLENAMSRKTETKEAESDEEKLWHCCFVCVLFRDDKRWRIVLNDDQKPLAPDTVSLPMLNRSSREICVALFRKREITAVGIRGWLEWSFSDKAPRSLIENLRQTRNAVGSDACLQYAIKLKLKLKRYCARTKITIFDINKSTM